MNNFEDTDEFSECCGNGCANCILDIHLKPPKRSNNKAGKVNILTEYTNFTLLEKVPHSAEQANVWELHWKSSLQRNNKSSSNFILDIEPGYHLMLRTTQNIDEGDERETKRKYLHRPYSPYWWDCNEMEFKILVNLKYNGPMTKFLKNLEVGEQVEFRGPIGQFEYIADTKGDKILFIISQGVAVAPSKAIIENVLNNDEDMTRIHHVACYEDIDHIYCRNDLYNYQKYWNYKYAIYLAHELCNNEECRKIRRCLSDCKHFRGNLKYKEPVHPFRFSEYELEATVRPLINGQDQVSVIIAGSAKFQKYFKDLLNSECYAIKEEDIHLL
ncbi:NADH-cytochrome b5 reductase-like [Haematobia irritans]|uniref:NADH-cytochrome b5 reductase-like n=1 Tax=Haematobia irritans TaxID=7368 RepID=UPI003F4FBEC5